jgi:hypothetical protein
VPIAGIRAGVVQDRWCLAASEPAVHHRAEYCSHDDGVIRVSGRPCQCLQRWISGAVSGPQLTSA